MLKIRVVKTGSSAQAVQAIRYYNSRRIIVKHFGSCHTADALDEMLEYAMNGLKTIQTSFLFSPLIILLRFFILTIVLF